jgi:hypothetical protein
MLTQHNRDGRWRNKISVGSWSTGNGDNRTREKNYTVLRRASVFKKKFPPSPLKRRLAIALELSLLGTTKSLAHYYPLHTLAFPLALPFLSPNPSL